MRKENSALLAIRDYSDTDRCTDCAGFLYRRERRMVPHINLMHTYMTAEVWYADVSATVWNAQVRRMVPPLKLMHMHMMHWCGTLTCLLLCGMPRCGAWCRRPSWRACWPRSPCWPPRSQRPAAR